MQEGSFSDVDVIARRLSLEINCSIRFPERGRTVLVCKHGVAFSMSRLRSSPGWSWSKEHHDKLAGG